MTSLVSIVVPIYNGENYIHSCLNSLLSQTYTNIEIILVDDGSKDNSGPLCDEYVAKDSRIKVCHKPNGGLSSARNAGIKMATGDYLWFVDVDDSVDKNTVEDNIKLAEENDADLIMFCFKYHDLDTNTDKDNAMDQIFVGDSKKYFEEMVVTTVNNEVFNAPWNKIVRKKILDEKNIRFHEEYPIYEDINFASEIIPASKVIVINPKMYYTYNVRSTGSLISRFFENCMESVTNYYKNIEAYCNSFEENEKQLERFSYLYTRLIYAYTKMVSCKKDLPEVKKQEVILKICKSDDFKRALIRTKLTGRKKVVRNLFLKEKYKKIIRMYKLLNFFQTRGR